MSPLASEYMYFSKPISPGLVVLALLSLMTTSGSVAAESEQSIVIEGSAQRAVPGMHGWTDLMNAAVDGDLQSVKALLAKGVEVNAPDSSGSTALMLAAYYGHLDVVRELIANGAEIATKDKRGATALSAAVERGRTHIVQELLGRGADPNAKTDWGRHILIAAAVSGYTEIVNSLISYGADVRVHGATALRHAAWKGHSEIVRSLIAAGVDVDLPREDDGRTALFMAVENAHIETIELLINRGADVNRKTKHGDSPLSHAVQNAQTAIVDVLVSNGAAVSGNLLTLAATRGHWNIVQRMFEQVDVSALTAEQANSALVLADLAGETQIVKAVLAKKASTRKSKASLIHVQDRGTKCDLKRWDPTTKAEQLLLSFESCPDTLFVAEKLRTVIIPTEDTVQEIVYDQEPIIKSPIQLPFKNPTKNRAGVRGVANAGYLADGRLALVYRRYRLTDDSDNSVYVYDNGEWKLIEQRYCHRWESCTFDRVAGRPWNYWPKEDQIWHPMLYLNPFVVDRKVLEHGRSSGGRRYVQHAIKLVMRGRESILSHFSSEGEHSFGLYTFSVSLQTSQDETPVVLTDGQCDTSIAHKYLLLKKYWGGGLHIIDLETGEQPLSSPKFATWVR